MLHGMWLTIFYICRLRLGPQDLPANTVLMVFTLVVYSIVNGLISVVQNVPLETAMLSGVTEALLSLIFTSSLLYLTHHPFRITQTVTAIASTGSFLGLIGIPLILWYQVQIAERIIGFSFILLFALIIWSLVVHAHILRHALAVPFFIGLTIAMVMLFLTVNILSTLFPFPE
jgi:hypothetical protein